MSVTRANIDDLQKDRSIQTRKEEKSLTERKPFYLVLALLIYVAGQADVEVTYLHSHQGLLRV